MRFSYYIYYRVGDAVRARDLVAKIQSAVREATGITGRLLAKRDDPHTWMEIYERIEDAAAFERCLGAAVRAGEFDKVLSAGSTRHIECFEDPCA